MVVQADRLTYVVYTPTTGYGIPGPELHRVDDLHLEKWCAAGNERIHPIYRIIYWDWDRIVYLLSGRSSYWYRTTVISMFNQYSKNTLALDQEQCIGCGMCVMVCPHGVFELKNGLANIVRYEACMECGACQLNCPSGAITVDSGVGCAYAMIKAALRGKKEVSCCGEPGGRKAEAASCCGKNE